MLINHSTNIIREVSNRYIDLANLLRAMADGPAAAFEYMGVSADDLNGLAGFLKLLYFELVHISRLRFMTLGTLSGLLEKERVRYNIVAARGERGRLIFDYRNQSYVLNRQTEQLTVEKRRLLANRVAEVEYSFVAGSKGICFDGRHYQTTDQVDMVASNEFAFAVAGGKTVEIFEAGNSYTFEVIAKKICWGAEGLFFVNDKDELWIVKEFRYGGTRYEARSLTSSVYPHVVPDCAELVGCDSLMCIVYRNEPTNLRIDVVNGEALSFKLDSKIEGRVLHFGAFYWQKCLTVFFVLDQQDGRISEYCEKNFRISGH